MARPGKQKLKDEKDFMRGLVEGLRRSARRPNIHGYEPHEKQILFHKSQAKVRQFIGGNRSGKTVGGATEAVWYAKREHPFKSIKWNEPLRGRIVAVDFLHGVAQIVLPEVSRWMPPSMLRNGSWEDSYDKETKTLYLEDGGFLEFMSYEQDLEKFAGTSRHFVWFDEEPPEDIYKECMARLIDTGGEAWMTMTPVEGMTWTYEQIYEKAKTDPNFFVVEVDITDNPVLSPVEIEAFLGTLDEDEREARKSGKYVQRGGLIYAHFGQHNIVEDFLPPKEWMHFAMMDHGFNNPTAWLWAAVSQDGDVYVYDEHYKSGEIVAYHARRVHEINQTHINDDGDLVIPSYYVGDPSIVQRNAISGTSVQTEYMDYGIPIMEGNNDVAAGLVRVATYLGGQKMGDGSTRRPKLYVTRRCENLLWELPRYRWAVYAQKKIARDRNVKDEPHKKDDHACDALRYGIMSRPEADVGQYVQEKSDGYGVPAAHNPYNLTDEELTAETKWYDSIPTDDVLGSEY